MKNATTIILLIIGLIAGIALCSLFTGSKIATPENINDVKHAADVKQTIREEEKLTNKIDSLKQKVSLADQQLKNTKQALNKLQKKILFCKHRSMV
ncbi:MAG: hypothetical protein ABUT20_40490 [Bacteroidota bacterium]